MAFERTRRAMSSFTSAQKHVVVASYLGWTLDAFDFFLMVFILKDIAAAFDTGISSVALAITLTLALRPVGAFLFGAFAERVGRRPALMINIAAYAILELLSGFAPNLAALLVLRSLFGIAMGGEWGLGSALTMETIPPRSRGFVSGLLQAGYPSGYLLASIVYGTLYSSIGWRGMFFVGIVPALLVLYIRKSVPESPAWTRARQTRRPPVREVLRGQWKLIVFMVILMTAFNFFSHGTQDLYPTFLQVQHHLSHATVSTIAIIYNIGAIVGGLGFGTLSERIGRRRAIIIAAVLALPLLPLWAFSSSVAMLAIGAFLMQVAVQGAWGVIPAYLNEMSPPSIRATFPGLVYQLGNLLASSNAVLQARLAAANGNNYGEAMAWVAGTVAIVIALLMLFGTERRGLDLAGGRPEALAR
jgi:MFS transporter, SHS family, lactate transporter